MRDPAEPANLFPRPPAPFPPEEYAARIERFRKALARRGIDGAIVSRHVSRLYLTGFDSSAGTLLISADQGALFAVDFRYIVMARRALPFARCVLMRPGGPDGALPFASKWRTAGYEGADSRAATDAIFARFSGVRKWEAVDSDLGALRSVKSALERGALRAAIRQGDRLFADAIQKISPGMSEWQIRNVFRSGADRLGHGESFETIVCAGKNGAECHHRPDATVLRPNMPLLVDFGVVLDNYHSDMTRCVSFGRPTPLYRKVYEIVLEANRAAIDGLRPGMTGAEVDAMARGVISRAGYGDAFGHSLGHSVGMEIHEGPNFSQSEKRVIKPGMVITVEPGIYLPGRLGVRIEDVVLVTRGGCEVLTRTPRELVSL